MLVNLTIEGLFFDYDEYADYILTRCTVCGRLMRVYLNESAQRFINASTAYELECAECVDDDPESRIIYFCEIEEDNDETNIDKSSTEN